MSGRSKGKAILVMVDGLGDLPKSFDDLRTPLQTAELPNLDLLCQHGLSGILDSVTAGLACGSDTAHMNIFGYDPRKYQFPS
jgi:2,3-bisphosphoglycerate-independent phosphoglycerate mutase